MHHPTRRSALRAVSLSLSLSLAALLGITTTPPAAAQTAATPTAAPQRLRVTIQRVDLPRITVLERSGEVITLTLPDDAVVMEVLPIAMSEIKAGSYIGTAASTGSDGRLRALEVLVFPEAARGTGEGHFPWDLAPQSTMTNATVADLASAPQGRELTLRYKDGEKKVLVPEGVPVVTFKPGDRALLVPGARAMITAVQRDGGRSATRLLVGRDGFVPPM